MIQYIILAAALMTAAPASAQPIEVQNAWARATAAGAKAAGIFVTITDKGGPDRLVGASTPVAAMAEVHETINDNGVMRMRPIPALPLQPGQAVVLKPGGYHIMLMGMKQQLKDGETFPLTLNFEKAGAITTTVHVAKAGAMGPEMAPGMKMSP
jgi:periplasmic copper chaperone A